MFLPRLVSTLSLICLIVFCIIKSHGTLSFIPPILISFLNVVALIEFYKMVEKRKVHINIKIISVISVIYIFCIHVFLKMNIEFHNLDYMFFVIVVFISFFVAFFEKNKFTEEHSLTVNAAFNVFSFIYFTWCLSFFMKILYFPLADGRYFILFLVFVSKATDIFSYIFGKLFGKNKLAPHISPNKTIEGAVAGVLGSFFTGIVFYILFLKKYLNLSEAIILSLIVPIISILGDLFESMIKRDMKIKDSGGVLPGLGGVFDLLDSLLLTAPIIYLSLILIF